MLAKVSPYVNLKAAACQPSMQTPAAGLFRTRSIVIFLAFSLVSLSSATNLRSSHGNKIQVGDNVKNLLLEVGPDLSEDAIDEFEEKNQIVQTKHATSLRASVDIDQSIQEMEGAETEAAPDSSLEAQVKEEELGAVSALFQQDTQSNDKMETENRQLREQVIKQRDFGTVNNRYYPTSRSYETLLSELDESSPGVKDEVIHMIINKFIAPTSRYKRYEKIHDAFEAIKFKVEDGEPVQIQGFPFLYVGTVGASMNHGSLLEHNITHVVNWSGSARCNVWQEINYHCILGIHGSDISRPESVKILSEAVEYVEKARLAGGSVLSHCWFGRNRSVTLLVAYLMKYAGMDMYEATRLIAKTRPQADPYFDALELYKEQYLE